MYISPKTKVWIAYVDLLLLMVGLFAVLMIVAWLQMSDAKKSGISMPAEYVIRMTWPDDAYDDIDLHLLLPSGRQVNFQTKDVEYATLDRDDLGLAGSDLYMVNGKPTAVFKNYEVITLRAIVPGSYAANVHVFSKRDGGVTYLGAYWPPKTVLPYPVHVSLERINPRVQMVVERDVTMTELGEQRTAFAFRIQDDGTVVDVDTSADLPFIPVKRPETGPT